MVKFTAIALLFVLVGVCYAAVEEEHIRRHEEHEEKKPEGFKLDERSKQILLEEKTKTHFVMEKSLEFFLNNPNRQFERECFAKYEPGQSVDFVIDVAPSPSLDQVDKSLAESPVALYQEVMGIFKPRSPSRSYFRSIGLFIESVTFDMKPENTHSIIYANGQKYYIRGKEVVAPISKALGGSHVSSFSDSMRNLKTMWPSATKEVPESLLHPVLKNNLGRMTKLALWNRNNGVPTVLAASRRSKPIYTIVITDGSSGAKINDLVDDLSRTTVIDIGNRRFVKTLNWNEMRQLVNVATLPAPQQLGSMVDTCRAMACRLCGCE